MKERKCFYTTQRIEDATQLPTILTIGCPNCVFDAIAALEENKLENLPLSRSAYFVGARAQWRVFREWVEKAGFLKDTQSLTPPAPVQFPESMPEAKAAAEKLARQVGDIYEFLDWEWAETGVPTEKEIVGQLLELYADLWNDTTAESIESGGLYCQRELDGGDFLFGFEIIERV